MAELLKGHVYNTGDTVDAPDLNNLVDLGTALKGIVMDQPPSTPDPVNDSLLFHDASLGAGGDLARCKISAIATASGVTAVTATIDSGATVLNFTVNSTVPAVPALHLGLDSQGGNKVLASPSDGSTSTPAFRALVSADMAINLQTVSASNIIDLTTGNVFLKTLTATSTVLHLANGASGQVIKVFVIQRAGGGGTLSWIADGMGGAIRWPGGVPPVLTTGSSHIDVFEFISVGSNSYYGIRWGTDMLL